MSERNRERSNAIARVVGTPRAILTYQVGLPVGATRMQVALSHLQVFETIRYPVFGEYMNAVTNLPIGSERLEWSYDVLKAKDKELEEINLRFRDRVFDAAHELLNRFGKEADDVRRRDRESNSKQRTR